MDQDSLPTTATPSRPASSHLDTLGTAACVFLALVTIGFAAFRRLGSVLPPGASRNIDRAFFTSVNAVTLTGFEQSFAEVPNFPPLGKALLAVLAVGGAMTTLICGGLFLRSIAGLAIRLRTIVALAAATVAVPWLLAWPFGPYDAASSATSLGLAGRHAFSTAGVATLVALSVPAVVGPIACLAAFAGRRPVWPPLRTTVIAWAAVYLVATLALALLGTFDDVGRVHSFDPRYPSIWFREATTATVAQLHGASTLAVDARGVGLDAAWPRAGGAALQWIVVAVMAIGSTPGGAAAGIGLLPLVLVGRQALLAIRGRADPLPAGPALAGVAAVSIVAWVAVAFISLVTLAATQPQVPGDRMLFIVVSALSNVGLSHDSIGLTGVGLHTLAATMLVGRMLPLATLCAMAVVAERSRHQMNVDERRS